ncbi:MAG: TIGR02391 family protein [Proteobacteria bacterium]|nr:TIGR02391 family protein [Pseudomonadota bacterium]
MAKRNKPEQPQPANLVPSQMKAALPILKRRISELQAIDVNTIQDRGEARFDALEQKIDTTLVDIFGNETVEYSRFAVGNLDTASWNMMGETSIYEVREGYKRGIEQAISNLQTIVELFEEKITDLGETPAGRALKALGELEIHPEIERAVAKLFRDGHYANAVEDACKVLDGLVKIRSGKYDLSGTELMQNVFSPKNPVLKFSDLQTQTEQSEQQGMMFLYAGAMLALRNPRAHEIIEDDPEKALEYIAFLSLLAKSLDKAKPA